MTAGKYGLALFSSVTIAHKTKNYRHKDEKIVKETATMKQQNT